MNTPPNNPLTNDGKLRYLLAIFLSSLIFIVWIYLNTPEPVPVQPETTSAPAPASPAAENPVASPEEDTNFQKNDGQTGSPSTASSPLENIVVEDTLTKNTVGDVAAIPTLTTTKKEERYTIASDVMQLEFSTKNATIVSARVANIQTEVFNRSTTKIQGFEKSISPNLEENGQSGFETGRVIFGVEDDQALFYSSHPDLYYTLVSKNENSITMKVQLSAKNRIVEIVRIYSIDPNDPFRLRLRQAAYDAETRVLLPLGFYLLNGSNLSAGDEDRPKGVLDIETLSYQVDDENEEILSTSFFGSDENFATINSADWIALDNRFYARVLTPLSSQYLERAVFAKKSYENGDEKTDYYLSALKMKPSKAESEFTWHFIPKNRELLDDYYQEEKLVYFDLFHQFSIMRILSSVMYWVLMRINGLVGNFGIAIILMTILIKLLTYPLTQKSMMSIAKMQKLTPKIDAIKAANKSNPQRLNTEMMMLYRKEKVSPLSGCLPMMLPIPIFIALYSLFQNMVELRGINFMWITDLSLPDTIATIGMSLPFIGSDVHLLPILMTVISFVQVFLPSSVATGTPENPQMKGMKYFFPVFFFFICWNLPSALVLFWTVQNVFSVLQSILLRRKMRAGTV